MNSVATFPETAKSTAPTARKPPPAESARGASNNGSIFGMTDSVEHRSIRDLVSPEEWQMRVDLAAAYRLMDHYGMTEMIYKHITARVPGAPDQFLIKA